MTMQTHDNEASAATDGSTSFVGGVWYPLGGQLEGTDSAWIMFHGPRRSGEKHEQTEQRFNDVLMRNGIELQDGKLREISDEYRAELYQVFPKLREKFDKLFAA